MLLCTGQLKAIFGKCMIIKRLWGSFIEYYTVTHDYTTEQCMSKQQLNKNIHNSLQYVMHYIDTLTSQNAFSIYSAYDQVNHSSP